MSRAKLGSHLTWSLRSCRFATHASGAAPWQRSRRRTAWHHRVLLGRTHHLALCGAQLRAQAGVAWYGRLAGTPSPLTPKNPLDLAAELKAPVLGLYGAQDGGIPVDTVECMRAACKETHTTCELVVYPDAGHAFHADYRPSYREGRQRTAGRACSRGFAPMVSSRTRPPCHLLRAPCHMQGSNVSLAPECFGGRPCIEAQHGGN